MADINEELRVLVTAEVDKAIKNLKSVDSQVKKTEGGFQALGKSISYAMIAKTVVNFGIESAKAFEESRATANLLNTTLQATGAVAWTSAEQLQQMASSIQAVTNFDDTAIEKMQAVLLGFKNIRSDNFERATKAIVDMSAVMGMDLSSAAQAVGKALDDPVNGIDSLRRQGFFFTEEQKKLIKSLLDVGDAAGAQKIILEELESTYGGAAEASKNYFSQLKNSWDDFKQSFGEFLNGQEIDVERILDEHPNLKLLVDPLGTLLTVMQGEEVNLHSPKGLLDAGAKYLPMLNSELKGVLSQIGGSEKFAEWINGLKDYERQLQAAYGALEETRSKLFSAEDSENDELSEKLRIEEEFWVDFIAGLKNAHDEQEKINRETAFLKSSEQEIDLLMSSISQSYETLGKDDPVKQIEALKKQLIQLEAQKEKFHPIETTGIEEDVKKLSGALAGLKHKFQNLPDGIAKDYMKKQIDNVQAELTEAQNKLDSANAYNITLGNVDVDGALAEIDYAEKKIEEKIKALEEKLQDSGKTKKSWKRWLADILDVKEDSFKRGSEAADIFLDGLERELENSKAIEKLFGNKQFKELPIIEQQIETIKKKIIEALNIDPSQIDENFVIEELQDESTALGTLYKEYQNLEKKRKEIFVKDEIKSLEKAVSELGKSEWELYEAKLKENGATEDQIKHIKELKNQLKEHTDLWDLISQKTAEAIEGLDGWSAKSAKSIGDLVSALAEVSLNALNDELKNLGKALGEGEKFGDAFKQSLESLGQELLNQLPKLLVNAGLQIIANGGPWEIGLALIAGGLADSFISGYVDGRLKNTEANALGGVYGDGSYSAFAKGGTFTNQIVSKPTYFRFAKGSGFGTGLMGEAGPEAIMPLTRGADGSLGVMASGSSPNVEVSIPVTVYSDEPVEVHDTEDDSGQRKIEVLVGSMINSHIAGGKADRALRNRYGLRVQGV